MQVLCSGLLRRSLEPRDGVCVGLLHLLRGLIRGRGRLELHGLSSRHVIFSSGRCKHLYMRALRSRLVCSRRLFELHALLDWKLQLRR